MTHPRYIVGIDLGTTNSVLAYTQAPDSDSQEPDISLFPLPQVVDAGRVEERMLLPSFLFLPGPHDVKESDLNLPWGKNSRAVGEFARERGAEIPSRLVSSAKSWLCNSGVDRSKPILPWEDSADVEKVSPVEASAAYLDHIRQAWNHSMAKDDPSRRLEHQEILLTVPASFDAVARELTVKAAEIAGLGAITLLEEPQAAFYAWIEGMHDTWRKAVKAGDTILVCDVGGGTTDFSLIRVGEDQGDLTLDRVAVGDHILVGGENMDLALAYALRRKFKDQGHNLDSWQMRILWHKARDAKEKLLLGADMDRVPVSIPGRGTGLIAGTLRSELSRTEIESILLDGFFPRCQASDRPAASRRAGIREFGLPYAEDPAITRYLAKFLAGAGDAQAGEELVIPTAVLFNGGVMKGDPLRRQLLEVLDSWAHTGARARIRELESRDLESAVARGAAYYGLARQGRGIRIRGGTGRSYYIGIESLMPAVPGVPSPLKALCVVPFGMEEGAEAVIPERQFGLVVGEQVEFHFLGSTLRKEDRCGDVVETWEDEIQEITTIETRLDSEGEEGSVVPVMLEVRVTEVGTLELWCVNTERNQRWKLEFNVREQ
ncbi:MAG: Hsp70 family protein [Deltaproteobacteria bacterium]|nr:Hsp70 family protein [Deltaproteobacteria bacterium]